MNLTKEQKRYIKRRMRELKPKKRGQTYWKMGFVGCLLLLGCSAFGIKSFNPDITPVLTTEAKFIEEKLTVFVGSFRLENAIFQHEKTVAESQKLQKASINLGCTPEKKPEPPAMVEPRPKPKLPPPVVEKAKPKVTKVAKAVIYKVKREGSMWTVRTNKSSKNLKVRIFIAYCYYEGIPDKDGNTKIDIDWHPPNQTKVGVSVFQLTNNPEIGSGKTLCSVVIPMP